METRLARLSSSDGSSISSLALGGGGCNSEDTGYSSDQDGRLSPVDKLDCTLKAGKRSSSKSRLKKGKKLCEAISASTGSHAQTLSGRCSERKSVISLSSSTSTATIQEAEAQFDQLSLCSSSGVSSHCKLSSTANNSFTESILRFSQDEDNDDGIFLNKSDLRSSKTSSHSAFSYQSSSSRFSLDSGSGISKKSSLSSSKPDLSSSHRTRDVHPSRSSFAQRLKNPLRWRTFHVDIPLPCSGTCATSDEKDRRDRSELCQRLLGIVPTWPEDVEPSLRGYIDVEVMVGSVVPGSPVSHASQDLQGRCPCQTVSVDELRWRQSRVTFMLLHPSTKVLKKKP